MNSTLFVPLAGFNLLLSASSAVAASSPENQQLEHIEVRYHQSYRGEVPLNDLPQAVQVIDQHQWQQWSLSRFQDVLDFSAGIARQNNGGGLWDSFSLRGFPGNENMPSGYLINGFNGGRGFSGHRDLSNVETIEILKGPGSALYGRSEPGGTVNIITRKPQQAHFGYLKASAGSYQQYRVEADYNASLNDQLAARINGAMQEYGSFRDEVSSDKTVITPSLLWQPTPDSSLLYEVEYLEQEQLFDRGIVVLDGNFQTLPYDRYLGEPSDKPTEINATGHQLSYQQQLASGWSFLAGAGYRDSTLQGFSSDAELALARQSLFSDGNTLTRQRRYRDYQSEDTTVRAEFSGRQYTGHVQHNLLLGADGYDYQLYTLLGRFRGAKGSYSLNIFNPQYGTTTAGPIATLYENVETQQAYGLYVQDLIKFNEQWQLLLGARFDSYQQEISELVKKSTALADANEISPRIGLVYQWSAAVSLYSNYAEGFLPLSGTDYAGAAFEPERSNSAEFGVKLALTDVTATLAFFSAEKSNILVSDPVNVGFSAALGAARSQGVELDVQAQLAQSVQLDLSYSLLNSETRKDSINPDWGVLIPAGSALVNIPRHTLSSQLVFQQKIFDLPLSSGLKFNYQSARLGDAVSADFILPSRALWSLFGSAELNPDTHLELVVDNLLNKRYIQSSYSALWAYPGEPRSIRMSLRYDF